MYRRNHNRNAISAIIGVIIMVAITVAMAAAAYAYFTGLIGQNEVTPSISFEASNIEKTIQVTMADKNVDWSDINISVINATGHEFITKIGPVNAGDTINLLTDQTLRGAVTVKLIHVPSNSFLDSYTIVL